MSARLGFKVSRELYASSDAIWRVLGDFGTEHRWSKQFDHCARDTDIVRVGTARICTLPKALMGRSNVREELTEYAYGTTLAYELDGPAGPFSQARSRWSTSAVSADTTVLTVEGDFRPRNFAVKVFLWPVIKPVLRRLTSRVLGELEVFVIAGLPSGSAWRTPHPALRSRAAPAIESSQVHDPAKHTRQR